MISKGLLAFYKVLIKGYFLVACAILVIRAEERWVQKTTTGMVKEQWVYLIYLAW